MKKAIIIGGSSAIAQATSRELAKRGYELYLISRNLERLQILCQDLKIRGAVNAHCKSLDINQIELHEETFQEAIETLGGLDLLLIAHGTLPQQKDCENDWVQAEKELCTNAFSTVRALSFFANALSERQKGIIAVITSVAGNRGRQSNYIYGSAKSMVSTFLQGLRNRLFKSGVHVIDIKPGFVDTPMTEEFKKGPLWAKPDLVARDIMNAIDKKKDLIYTPFFWRYIMFLIGIIPERIFKKLRL